MKHFSRFPILKLASLIFLSYILLTAQTCTPAAKLGCNGINFTYSELEEHPPSQGFPDGYNTVDIFYSNTGNELHGFTIDFKYSHFSDIMNSNFQFGLDAATGKLTISSGPNGFGQTTSQTPQYKIGVLKYVVPRAQRGNTATGEFRVAYLNNQGQEIPGCDYKYALPI